MPSIDDLKQQSEELRRGVSEKLKEFEGDKITLDEFVQVREKAEKDSEKIGVAIKNLRAAQGLAGSADPQPDGEPPTPEAPSHIKQYQEGYQRMKSAADPLRRRMEQVSFEFGHKSYQDDLRDKAQGVTGLSGVDATGTSTPAALAGGTYFLTGTAGPFVAPEFIPQIVNLKFYENVVAQLIPSYATDSPVVTWVRESSWTNNAAGVPEGATKPTSTHGFTRFTTQVGKIAVLERVTDELIQDAPLVWSLIQQRLVQGVQRKEEVELLAGAGYPSLPGLLSFSTSFTLPQTVTAITSLVFPAAGTPGIGAATDTIASVTPGRNVAYTIASAQAGMVIAEGLLQAITDIRVQTFFEPDAIIMNPYDYLTVRLAKDLNDQYFGGAMFGRDYGQAQFEPTPQATNTFGLWGKKVVTTPAMPAGLALVGDFAGWTRVLRHGGLRVDMTNTNGTDFEQNLWTARAEERIGLMVERPEVFELVKLTGS
jgi:HK97 family phage major capsid protein